MNCDVGSHECKWSEIANEAVDCNWKHVKKEAGMDLIRCDHFEIGLELMIQSPADPLSKAIARGHAAQSVVRQAFDERRVETGRAE